MADFIEGAVLAELADGSGVSISRASGTVAVFAAGGRLFALEDICLACSRSLTSGQVCNLILRCPGCGWQYRLETGEVIGVPGLYLQTFDVVMENSSAASVVPAAQPPRSTK